jgi:hypothetical protein
MNSKQLLSLTITTATYLSFPIAAFAETTCPGGQFSGLCLDSTKLGSTVGSLISFIFVIAGLIALFFLIWGGIKWLMSGGDEKAVEGARSHIIASIIGLVIIFMSYLIVNVVLNFFTGGKASLTNLTLPTL